MSVNSIKWFKNSLIITKNSKSHSHGKGLASMLFVLLLCAILSKKKKGCLNQSQSSNSMGYSSKVVSHRNYIVLSPLEQWSILCSLRVTHLTVYHHSFVVSTPGRVQSVPARLLLSINPKSFHLRVTFWETCLIWTSVPPSTCPRGLPCR